MPSYLGIDWAAGCWLVVKTGDSACVTTEPSILNVWHEHGKGEDVQSILIDIPIGLPTSRTRACDEEASELLAGRQSTVFSIPSRDVVEINDYERAKMRNDGSLGSQSWWLFPRIKEVDVFLREHSAALEKVYESHPEVCFAALGGTTLASKTTDDGRSERLDVLREDPTLYDEVVELVRERADGAEWHDRISKGRLDDVLDAAVLALTAKRLDLGRRTDQTEYPALPKEVEPANDSTLGIPLEIVYPGTAD